MAREKFRFRAFIRSIPQLMTAEYWRGEYNAGVEWLQKTWREDLFPPPGIDLRMAQTVYVAEDRPRAANVCLFSAFSYGDAVSDYAIRYVAELHRCGLDIVYLSASPLSRDDIAKLSPYCRMIVEKDNVCPDFSAWKIGLLLTDNAKGYDNVLLTNDSVFGPMRDLKTIIDEMNSRELDFWGMTDSREGKHHLQSYFLWITRQILDGRTWAEFWRKIRAFENKLTVCWKYEIELTAKLAKAGYEFDAYARSETLSTFDCDNPLNGAPNSVLIHAFFLIDKMRFPFLKRGLFRQEFHDYLRKNGEKGTAYRQSLDNWKDVVTRNTSYPPELIEEELAKLP